MPMANEEKQEPAPGQNVLTVVYKVPEGMPQLFTDLLVSQFSTERGVFFLNFFQSQIPMDTAAGADSIEAECIARLVLTPQVMVRVVELLNRNFEKFREAAIRDMEAATPTAGGE